MHCTCRHVQCEYALQPYCTKHNRYLTPLDHLLIPEVVVVLPPVTAVETTKSDIKVYQGN